MSCSEYCPAGVRGRGCFPTTLSNGFCWVPLLMLVSLDRGVWSSCASPLVPQGLGQWWRQPERAATTRATGSSAVDLPQPFCLPMGSRTRHGQVAVGQGKDPLQARCVSQAIFYSPQVWRDFLSSLCPQEKVKKVEILASKPRTSCMLSMYSTTELHSPIASHCLVILTHPHSPQPAAHSPDAGVHAWRAPVLSASH